MREFPRGAQHKGGQAAAVTNRRLAEEFYRPLLPVVAELRQQGLSLRAIAAELNARGIPCRIGFPRQQWRAEQVRRMLARAARSQTVTEPDQY